MKLSVADYFSDDPLKKLCALNAVVTLDGAEQNYVVMADEEAGVVVLNPRPLRVRGVDLVGQKVRRGKVEITFRHDSPAAVRAAYPARIQTKPWERSR